MKADAGDWILEPRLSLSGARSNLDTPLQRIGAVSPIGVSYAFDLGPNLIGRRKAPLLSTAFDLTDPGRRTFSRYGVRATHVRDHDITGLIAAQRPVDADARAAQGRTPAARRSDQRTGAKLSTP